MSQAIEAQTKVGALSRRVAELETDRERLDWLCAAPDVGENHAASFRLWDGEGDFRDAIDAAMMEKP
jgi:hypothetical protein